jgi:hypothetical protein
VSPAPLAMRADAAGRPAGRAMSPGEALAVLRADPRRAIQEDAIRCLECGRAMRQLTNTHLRSHGTTATDYKRHFGYNRGRPLMCLALQRLYVERAVKSGLASQIRSRPIVARPELRRRGGSRPISLEEFLTRREARQKAVPVFGLPSGASRRKRVAASRLPVTDGRA